MNGYEVGGLEGGSSLESELKASANLAQTSGQAGSRVPLRERVRSTISHSGRGIAQSTFAKLP